MFLEGESTQQEKIDTKGTAFNNVLDSSFSSLEEDGLEKQEDECQEVTIDVHEEESDEALLKQTRTISMSDVVHEEKKAEETSNKAPEKVPEVTGQVKSEQANEDIDEYLHKVKSLSQFQQFEQKYLEKIKVIYAFSLLGSERISLANIQRLKTFLFIPIHGEELVRWGNEKYGTQHTAVSALERLEHLQQSECNHYAVKCRQQIRYIIALLFCIVILKIMI